MWDFHVDEINTCIWILHERMQNADAGMKNQKDKYWSD